MTAEDDEGGRAAEELLATFTEELPFFSDDDEIVFWLLLNFAAELDDGFVALLQDSIVPSELQDDDNRISLLVFHSP